MIVFATLGAPERRRLAGRRRARDAQPQPEPTPVATGRATVIDVGQPAGRRAGGRAPGWTPRARMSCSPDWASSTGRCTPSALVTADPYLPPPAAGRRWSPGSASAPARRWPTGCGPRRASCRPETAGGGRRAARGLLAPAGAAGRRPGWPRGAAGRRGADAPGPPGSRPRAPAGGGAAAARRARRRAGRARPPTPHAAALADRLAELRGQREAVAAAAQAALSGPLTPTGWRR